MAATSLAAGILGAKGNGENQIYGRVAAFGDNPFARCEPDYADGFIIQIKAHAFVNFYIVHFAGHINIKTHLYGTRNAVLF